MTMNEIEAYLEDIATELLFSSDEKIVNLGNEIMNKLIEHREEYEQNYNDSMDGDHASALASAGMGTDEDYGHTGDNNDY